MFIFGVGWVEKDPKKERFREHLGLFFFFEMLSLVEVVFFEDGGE